MSNNIVLGFVALLLLLPALGFPEGREISLGKIRKINKNGPYLGLITVYDAEEKAFFDTGAFMNDSRYPYIDLAGRRFRVGRIQGIKVIYVKCGKGLVNGAAGTQQMLDTFDISGLVHFGVSGNTNQSLHVGDVVIPKEFANTGLWDWMKPDATVAKEGQAKLDVKDYNLPNGGSNSLGIIAYRPEEFYSEATNIVQKQLWFQVTAKWLQLATSLQGMKLEKCVNSSSYDLCLPREPKLVVGLRGSTANMFLDNGDYREFLFKTFRVSSTDMESSAVVMTSISNGYPVIVIRGMSDLAGGQDGHNVIKLFESVAASNVAKVVVQFIKLLSRKSY